MPEKILDSFSSISLAGANSPLELERRVFHLKTLYEVSQVVGVLRDPQQIMRNLLMMVMGVFGAPRGVAFLFEAKTPEARIVVQRGGLSSLETLLNQTSDRASGFVDNRFALLDWRNVTMKKTPTVPEVLASCGLRVWAPFIVNERHRGGIALGEKLSREPYSADDQELLGTITNQLTIALDNALAYREIEDLNQSLEEKVRQRTEELRQQHEQLQETHKQLELRNRFIENAFGRYVSDEVVSSLIASPERLRLGGEKRKATIVMSDLRGFTALAEKLSPEEVVTIVNRYLGIMVDVVLRFQGTINEFIGDAILVLFGVPMARDDDAQRAVACAIAMQQAIETVNTQNRRDGLPAVEMGIGVHTGEVVVGNIGSQRRMKYGVVGSAANFTSRVESYTVGGQILISEATWREVGGGLDIAQRIEVEAKGFEQPLILYDVKGILGKPQFSVPRREDGFSFVQRKITVRCCLLEGKYLSQTIVEGRLGRLSFSGGEIYAESTLPPLSNICMQLVDGNGKELLGNLYGKVLAPLTDRQKGFAVRFTSTLPDAVLFRLLRRGAAHDSE